ncbi:valine--tRNA ligase [Roseospira marina]|uniref:Valine--tRNA ligase n=1 Tax=Roseospira marina TaxID=140057 RepID=A0A5M6IFB3_9PROT|nr:valine--tRNA ligase [Roseospira marina]KAA5606976.1 valine--tRNA ligase [Roseospira marina]MBB4312846.1 valyl-tRNA synthetase [Roseospira marina]MBB5086381.1 valyl-tRNA synthetase [Roseospira marina]
MLDKTYDPQTVEQRLYRVWEDSGVFGCAPESSAAPYTIMMPPPNVTGSLHMGHALTFTLQDVLIRYFRMTGRDTLWQPGSDHAGIATQMVVERNLAAEGKTRHDFGRDAFVDKVWEWKAQSGGTIQKQLRRLGASPDWPRERFTMDEGLSRAVTKVFVTLHKQGLMYRDKRLVNWDPKLHTAISDLEVEQRPADGHMWYFKYPVQGEPDRFVVVGTTRPETMLGDTGVAVHPEDERYTDLVGKTVVLPIVDRPIPVVADDYADPEKGSGAVKITPAHDFNDFEVGRRCGLEMINVLDRDARLNENAPAEFQGMDRFEARTRIVERMETLGLLEKIEPNPMTVPYGDRSGVVIEPWLTDQWFVDAAELAKEPIKAVEDGRTRFVPAHWSNTFFEWMRNIQPWCVSRQIWWGHRIPAWYGPDGTIFVEESEEQAQAAATAHYGKAVELSRDTDVLDTWFSSALWPFSTLGWPDETPELARYYPGDVLVTGFDIIFFWVARMMMMGHHFMGDVPFRDVYIHALVRDEKGQKMSKSKGNVIDPLDLIEKYGTDALRFTLTAMAAQGRDIKMSESRVQGYRNFATKLWNAARFCELNGCAVPTGFDPAAVGSTLNRWIVARVADTAAKVGAAIEAYRFNEAAQVAYQFTWNTFCDWFLEFAKPVFNGTDEAAAAETRATAAWVLDRILVTLHPIMPFVTEELWGALTDTREGHLMAARWPDMPDVSAPDAEAEMDWLVGLITAIRSVRAEMNVPPAARLALQVKDANATTRARLDTHRALVGTLARVDAIDHVDSAPASGSAQIVVEEATVILPLADVIDLDAERKRLARDVAKQDGEIAKLSKKLANEGFLAKAPAEVVAENRERLADLEATRERLKEALTRIG